MAQIKDLIAECFGTFVLTFVGCGAFGLTQGVLGTAIAFGLVYFTMIYTVGRVHDLHMNPTVSFAFFLRDLDAVKFILYFAAQIIGALIGTLAVFGFAYMSLGSKSSVMIEFFNDGTNNILDYTHEGGKFKAGNTFGGLLTEFVLSFLFVYIFFCGSQEKNLKDKGLLIGSGIAMLHLVGISITGCSLNFARSLAAAITQPTYFGNKNHKAIEQIWIWFIATFLGAAAAKFFFDFMHGGSGRSGENKLSDKGEPPQIVVNRLKVDSNDN